MTLPATIAHKLKTPEPVFSVEFFPPRNDEGARQILETAAQLQPLRPDFVSITYGAGGSTRERTLEYGKLLAERFNFDVMPHLTCVGHARSELAEIIATFEAAGFRNIMALRGDPPKGQTTFTPHPDGFRYASELVAFIRKAYPQFGLGVGGYPETHPEAASAEADLDALKAKVEAGGDFITTQLFLDNADYFRYVERCRARGITVPILPGILPALGLEQVKRFCSFCQASIPPALLAKLEAVQGDPQAEENVGIEWAYAQCRELLAKGAPGVHLYILNRSHAAVKLFSQLRGAVTPATDQSDAGALAKPASSA